MNLSPLASPSSGYVTTRSSGSITRIPIQLSVKTLHLTNQLNVAGDSNAETNEKVKSFANELCILVLQAAMFSDMDSELPSLEYFETEIRRGRVMKNTREDNSVRSMIAAEAACADALKSRMAGIEIPVGDAALPSISTGISLSAIPSSPLTSKPSKLEALAMPSVVNSQGKGYALKPMWSRESLLTPGSSPIISPPSTTLIVDPEMEYSDHGLPPRFYSPNIENEVLPIASDKTYMLWDQIADLLLRLCFQMENLVVQKKANYYGVFDARIITREILSIIGPRLKKCCNELSQVSSKSLFGNRNAPSVDCEFKKSPSSSSIRSIASFTKKVNEITGQIFWEEKCGNKAYVSWNQFSTAFQDLYGRQPTRAMDQLMKALCSTDDTQYSSIDNKAKDGNSSSGITKFQNCPPTPGGTPNINSFSYGSNSMGRSRSSPRLSPRSSPLRLSPSKMNKSMVKVEKFSKFCVNNGGLLEGFLSISDPATQLLCLGQIEDNNSEGNQSLLLPYSVVDFVGVKILQVSCGGEHVAVLLEGGVVATYGKGGFGRLGHGTNENCKRPKHVEGLMGHTCAKVRCGFAYTTAVTVKGNVYSWGAGENGRLGLGDEIDRMTPHKILLPLGTKVRDVQAGSVHTCLLTEKGNIYCCGKREYAGLCSKSDVFTPKKLDCFGEGRTAKRFQQLSVGPGGYHTIALSTKGEVYAWGHNRVGQLGYSSKKFVPNSVQGAFFIPSPKLVEGLSGLDVIQVVAGWGHSAAVTRDGSLFTCGRNFQGQLGLGDPSSFNLNERGHPHQPEYKRVEALEGIHISHAACGGEHSVAVSKSGEVYTFGLGVHGQLGHGTDYRTQIYPKRVEIFKEDGRATLQLACGNNCTLALRGYYTVPSLFAMCREKIIETMDKGKFPPVVASIFEHFPENKTLPSVTA